MSSVIGRNIRKDSMCEGKKIFTSYTEAHEARRLMGKHFSIRSMDIYKCRYCHHWHMGNNHDAETFKRKNHYDRKEARKFQSLDV